MSGNLMGNYFIDLGWVDLLYPSCRTLIAAVKT